MDPLWDLTRAMAVSLLLKGCHYHAILISASKDHGSCMCSGYSPSLWLIAMNHCGTCTGISVLWFQQVWLALRSLASEELEKLVLGEMDLSAEGKSQAGLGVRPACVLDLGSATTGCMALGKWFNRANIWMSVNRLSWVLQERTVS